MPPTTIGATPKALHTSVREALWDRMHAGLYPAGSQIPSEAALCAEFGVSRITVRHALSELHRLGRVFKIHGKGTFVSRPRPLQHFAPVVGFGEAMRRAGHDVLSKLLSMDLILAPPTIAERLGLSRAGKVYRLRRLRYLDQQPARLDVLYLPVAIGSRLVGVDLSRRDVFSFFQSELGIEIGDLAVELEAIPADSAMAKHLGIGRGAPLLRIESLAYRDNGDPLDFAEIYCRSNVSRYGFWVTSQSRGGR